MKKILIFEDDRNDFNAIVAWLTDWGYEPIPTTFDVIAQSLDNGDIPTLYQELIQKNWYDELVLFICDLMAKGNRSFGIDLIEKIRIETEHFCPIFPKLIPIIAYTGVGNNTQKNDALIKGADILIPKIGDKPREDHEDASQEYQNKVDFLKKSIRQLIARFDAQLSQLIPLKKLIFQFKKEHSGTNAFIMTSYKQSNESYIKSIKDILKTHNINAHLASDVPGGKSSPEKWKDIEIYMHACDFGIAIITDDFSIPEERFSHINSNVSLEVGYMLSLKKSVLILKHNDVKKNISDLDEKLFISFQDETELTTNLTQFLRENNYLNSAQEHGK